LLAPLGCSSWTC